MTDIIAIAKMRRSRLCAALARFDAFIAIGEELLAFAESNAAEDSSRKIEPQKSFVDGAPWCASRLRP